MFRLVDKLPDTYVNQSRDFQLLCALFDLVQNSTKSQIDSILSILSADTCPDTVLPLLQTKLGFFVKNQHLYTSDVLRLLLTVLPNVVKNKGNRRGLAVAINIFMKILNLDNKCTVYVENAYNSERLTDYVVLVRSDAKLTDTRILEDIFEYIMPAGYVVVYESVADAPARISNTYISDAVTRQVIENASRQITRAPDENTTYSRNTLFNIGGTGTTVSGAYSERYEKTED